MDINQPDTAKNTEHFSSTGDSFKLGQDILDYLLLILKHKKTIFGTTVVVAVITALYSFTLPNIYTAKTMILPGEDDKGMMGAMLAQMGGLAGVAGAVGLGGPSKADLYVTMLQSEAVKDPIIDRFKLMDVYKAKLRVDAYNALAEATEMTFSKRDGVITIKVNDKDPKRAADLANAFVDELGNLSLQLGMTSASGNKEFFDKRLAVTKVDLDRAENNLKLFQFKNKAVSVTDQAKATIEGLAQLRAQLAVKEVELSTLQRQFTDRSQEVKTTKSIISSLRSQIAYLEGNGTGSSSMPTVGSVPKLGQEYVRLMREFKIQEAIFEMLTKQYELMKINEVKDVSSLQIIQKAKVPERKSMPKRSFMVIMAAFSSFIVMLLLVFAREFCVHMFEADQERWDQVLKQMPILSVSLTQLQKLFFRQ